MVDIDGHSSDTGGEPSIYPDPEHAAHSSWLTALPGLNDFTTNNATEGVKQFTRRFGCAPNDLPGRSDDVFSPENAFIDIAESDWFSGGNSDASSSSKGLGNSASRVKRRRHDRSGSLQGRRVLRGGRGARRGPRQAVEPDSGFKVLYSQATDLFVAGDYPAAEQCIQHAIRTNPEIFAAHSLLSAIYMERGDKERALTALFFGAHTRPTEKKVWDDVAKLILERAGEDHLSAVRDAIYCYNRIVGLDPKDLEARRHRAGLNCELGNITQALTDYNRILNDSPEHIGVLRRLAELYTELGEAAKATIPFEACLTYCQSLQPEVVNLFDWSDVNIYAELCTISFEPQVAIQKLKAFARWLLGRLKEKYWDDINEDDREYDAEDKSRRIQVPHFFPGEYDQRSYGLGLPLELRVKLGILRLNIRSNHVDDHLKEAVRHFEWLEPAAKCAGSKLFDYADLFRDVGDALRKHGHFLEALRFYEPLKMVNLAIGTSYLKDVAHCYEKLQMFDQAEQCYEIILEHDRSSADVQFQLTSMFILADMPERASGQLTKFRNLRADSIHSLEKKSRQFGSVPTSTANSQAGSFSHLTLSTDRQTSKRKVLKITTQPKEPLASLHDLDESWLQMKLAKERLRRDPLASWTEWMNNARIVTDNFKSQPSFFPAERNTRFSGYRKESGKSSVREAAILQQRIDDPGERAMETLESNDLDISLPTFYCGVSFEHWLDVFLEYALLLSRHGDEDSAYAILESASLANVFRHSRQWMFNIHVCWLVCAAQANDSETVCIVARYFMREHPLITDGYRLFVALNRVCQERNSSFNATPSQKFILRQVKAMDQPFLQASGKLASGKQSAVLRMQVTMNPGSVVPEEMDVVLLMLYGQILCSGTSYTSALNYFFRAYALDPSNPMINLCLSLGYLHYALKRQSENRHYLIMQGISFLFAYYYLRQNYRFTIGRQEAEYNVGRACEMLGLTHMAIESYRQCISLSGGITWSQGDEFSEDFATDAAFALQRLFLASGDAARANSVTRAWLVV